VAEQQQELTKEQIDQALLGLAGGAVQAARATNDERLKRIANVAVQQVKGSSGLADLLVQFVAGQSQQVDTRESARQQATQQTQELLNKRREQWAKQQAETNQKLTQILDPLVEAIIRKVAGDGSNGGTGTSPDQGDAGHDEGNEQPGTAAV
jgi:truncated hemoglobin YjbI